MRKILLYGDQPPRQNTRGKDRAFRRGVARPQINARLCAHARTYICIHRRRVACIRTVYECERSEPGVTASEKQGRQMHRVSEVAGNKRATGWGAREGTPSQTRE